MATVIEPRTDFVSPKSTSSMASHIRMLFRQMGLFHAFQHDRMLITVDVPFQLKRASSGRSIAILINKACLPRKYPLENLLSSNAVVEKKLGMYVEIQQKDEWIVFCLDIGGATRSHINQ